ncbi:MAG: hypothetical protein BJ554DRAFT_4722, partial [Olpidium bornovanus]
HVLRLPGLPKPDLLGTGVFVTRRGNEHTLREHLPFGAERFLSPPEIWRGMTGGISRFCPAQSDLARRPEIPGKRRHSEPNDTMASGSPAGSASAEEGEHTAAAVAAALAVRAASPDATAGRGSEEGPARKLRKAASATDVADAKPRATAKLVQAGIQAFFSAKAAGPTSGQDGAPRRSAAGRVEWREEDGAALLIGRFGNADYAGGLRRVAAFDVDGTIICPNGPHRHPKSATDWKFWHRNVPKRLRELHEEGYIILMVSNQSRMSKYESHKVMFRQKMNFVLDQVSRGQPFFSLPPSNFFGANARGRWNLLCAQVGVPLHLLVATGHSCYRKPAVGIWDYFVRHIRPPDVVVDIENSFFVGDAAGRVSGSARGSKKDFAATDRKWAINIGLAFHTPEEFFLEQKYTGKIVLSEGEDFNPIEYIPQRPLFMPTNRPLVPDPVIPEIVIFVGYPAAGKTTFALKWLVPKGYRHINQLFSRSRLKDTMKTKEKCLEACQDALEAGHPAVIDNTNPDVSTRKAYIDLGRRMQVPVRCFHFQAGAELARHNDLFRAYGLRDVDFPEPPAPAAATQVAPRRQRRVVAPLPDLAFASYRKRCVEPDAGEGFAEIKRVNFSLDFSDVLGVDHGGDLAKVEALRGQLEARWRRWYR